MHRRTPWGASRLPAPIAAALATAVALGACSGGVSPSQPVGPTPRMTPDASMPEPTTAPAPSPSPSPSPTPGPPFDPTKVSITFELYATVPGAPLAITHFGDGSGRLLVAAKLGQLRIVRDGELDPDPMLDIGDLVSGGYEQGLLGVAVHPDFPADPRVFVHYTDANGDTVVASYALAPGDPDRLDPATATTILAVDQPYANHNGGALAFGPDGFLYVSLGDGGAGGDPHDNGQSLATLLGKILRLDVDRAAGGAGYDIPDDNPFVGVDGARPEIWLTGLRNPWRIAFDRATGDLWIGDVGQGDWEEVDVARSGEGGLNFGWNTMEGAHCFDPREGCDPAGLALPITEYGHADGCTIIGGVVYRGVAQPLLAGGYLFGDYCSGRLWAIPADAPAPLDPVRVGTAGNNLAAFGEDEAGETYAANLDGAILRVVATAR